MPVLMAAMAVNTSVLVLLAPILADAGQAITSTRTKEHVPVSRLSWLQFPYAAAAPDGHFP